MTSVEKSKPSCPVCHRADQVKTTQVAYDSGVARCAPPDLPTKTVSMFSYILFSMVLVGLCIFLVIVLIGSEAKLANIVQLILVGVTLVSIIIALTLSYVAFQRVVQSDAESTLRFPAWDRAMETWRGLYYCSRDEIVFDPKMNKPLTSEQLAILRTIDEPESAFKSVSVAH